MSGGWLAGYVGMALAYALASTGAILVLLALARRGRGGMPGLRHLPLLGLTAFFVFLAISPFPDPAGLDCSGGGLAPQLRPFRFLDILHRLDSSSRIWASDVLIVSTAMNFLLCAAIGAAALPFTRRAHHALAFGMMLSLGIELSQLTGLWGIYPCAYRQFDVDDLILNVGGVMAGFLIARGLRRPARA